MAEKRIEIQMAAVNAAETAAEIGKSTDAVKGLTTATDEQFKLSLEQAEEEAKIAKHRAEAARERAEQADQESRDLKENVETQKGRAKEIAGAVGAIAAAAKFAAESLSEVATAIDSVDMEALNKIDPKVAEEFQKMEFWARAATSPIKSIIDSTSEWLLGDTVGGAFENMNAALANAAIQHAASIDRMISSGIRQTDEIKRLADEVKAANAILDAKGDADAAARDRADAAAKRQPGANAAEIDKARAQWDADQAVAKIERDRMSAEDAAQTANENADTAVNNAVAVNYDPTSTPEDRAKANDAAKAAQAERERLADIATTARRVAAERIRATREKAAGRIEQIDGDQAAQRKAADDKMYSDHADFNDRLEKEEGKRIEAEAAKAAKAASGMGTAAVAGFRKLAAEMEQLKKQVEIQGNQIKNQRRGR